MKRCPKCGRSYADETQNFCLDDGAWLADASSSSEPQTAIMPGANLPSEPQTRIFQTDAYAPTVSMSGYQPNSIAVLPFAHLSSDPDDEYFCDGLAEELINALSRVDDLKVVARTSAFSFKGKNIDIGQVGSALNVNNVVEGSVRKFGDRMRISVSLTGTADGFNIWSDKYDTEMRDLFDVQDEIALSVVNALKSKLLGEPDESERMAALIEDLKHHASDVEAYRLYLRGRYFVNKFTTADAFKAVELFDQAIAADPRQAAAYAGLADAYIMLTEMGPMPPHEAMPKAKAAALKALELDASLAEAHSSLGMVLQDYEYDFAAAEGRFKKAIELSPNNPIPRQSYGILLTELERFDEAERHFKKLFEVDPLSVVGNWIYSFCLFLARRYDDSLDRAMQTLELDPNFGVAYLSVAFAHQMTGKYDESVEAYAKCSEVMGFPENAEYVRESYKSGWDSFLTSMAGRERPMSFSSYIVAVFAATLGDHDRAFEELNASYDARESHIVMVKCDPRFDGLRSDPRFEELSKKIGFPE
jgi:TolB-like protein